MPTAVARERLEALLAAAALKRIAVVGDVMLDVYLVGDAGRISPEAPVPVVRVHERRYALGGSANVAQNIAALGAACDLVGAIGSDAGGTRLREMLSAIGTDPGSLITVPRCTTTKTRIVARSQQLVRVDEEDDADLAGDDVARLIAAVTTAVSRADALVLEDYNKGVLQPQVIRAAIDAAAARRLPIVVDPKFRNFFAYGGATIFKPNRRELESAVGASLDLEHPEAIPTMIARLGVEHLLLTLGEHGMVLFSAAGDINRMPAAAREVYDVVGAGDTVTAYLAAMLAVGATPVEAADIANIAAGIEVAKLGAASVRPDEVMEYAFGAKS